MLLGFNLAHHYVMCFVTQLFADISIGNVLVLQKRQFGGQGKGVKVMCLQCKYPTLMRAQQSATLFVVLHIILKLASTTHVKCQTVTLPEKLQKNWFHFGSDHNTYSGIGWQMIEERKQTSGNKLTIVPVYLCPLLRPWMAVKIVGPVTAFPFSPPICFNNTLIHSYLICLFTHQDYNACDLVDVQLIGCCSTGLITPDQNPGCRKACSQYCQVTLFYSDA